jgi:hypothetical protein
MTAASHRASKWRARLCDRELAVFPEAAELRKTIQEVEICDSVHEILFGQSEGTQRAAARAGLR